MACLLQDWMLGELPPRPVSSSEDDDGGVVLRGSSSARAHPQRSRRVAPLVTGRWGRMHSVSSVFDITIQRHE